MLNNICVFISRLTEVAALFFLSWPVVGTISLWELTRENNSSITPISFFQYYWTDTNSLQIALASGAIMPTFRQQTITHTKTTYSSISFCSFFGTDSFTTSRGCLFPDINDMNALVEAETNNTMLMVQEMLKTLIILFLSLPASLF